MSSKKFDLVVNIGRFEPLHLGHIKNFWKSLEYSDNLLVCFGSADSACTAKNPFTYEERLEMFNEAFITYTDTPVNIFTAPIKDYLYDENRWIISIQEAVSNTLKTLGLPETAKVAILGYEKDSSSYYLRSFPTWEFINICGYLTIGNRPIDATDIRTLMFEDKLDFAKSVVHDSTYKILESFVLTPKFRNLQEEYNFIKMYKKSWDVAPYKPTFMCADAVCIQGGHVALVKRKAAPGKGLWAIPGGYVNQEETIEEAAIRELREETRIKVPPAILKSNITHKEVFDHPGRSLRGRTITVAYLIELPVGPTGLDKLKGADDAEKAKWIPISKIGSMGPELFEDHFSILEHMIQRAQ